MYRNKSILGLSVLTGRGCSVSRKDIRTHNRQLWIFLEMLAVVAMVGASGQRVSAQGTTEVRFYSQRYGRYVSRYSGGTLTVELTDTPRDYTREGCENGDTVCGHWEGTSTAQVSDLDLENVTIQQGCCDAFGLTSTQGFGFMIDCKRGEQCVSRSGQFTGFTSSNMGSGNGAGTNLVVSCETREECSNFLEVLKGHQRPAASSRVEAPASQVRPEPSQPRATPTTAPMVQPRTPSSADPFRDILDGISWRNGGSANSTLDQLAKKTVPAPNKPTPPVARPTYAAFAQSGGFEANDGWGSATGTDLNSTISQANSNCVNRAGTTCDDQGYCMLRPGLWGALASDQKYLGNKAFACNLKTEEEARNQALAWCGFGCKVLWTGAGQ